jgi:nitrite reductase/ring-hydroxylating ferredoxin subunit
MPLIRVARVPDVPPDSVVEVSLGEQTYAICNVDGQIWALDGICAHLGGPLGQGNVVDGRVICPWHAWEFDCRTGENCFNPGQRVATYPVKVEDNDIYLQVP